MEDDPSEGFPQPREVAVEVEAGPEVAQRREVRLREAAELGPGAGEHGEVEAGGDRELPLGPDQPAADMVTRPAQGVCKEARVSKELSKS